MKQYCLYLNSIERFILINDDIWTSMNTAKVLSSKMCLCVCEISNQNLDNDSCLEWGLVDSSESKQTQQHPSLSIIKKGACYRGYPVDIASERLIYDKKFVEFVYRITKASMLVDALMNNVNQKFYLELLDENEIMSVNDDSGIKGGFLKNVNKILYLSNSVDEISEKLNVMFDDKQSDRPTNLMNYKKMFDTFFKDE